MIYAYGAGTDKRLGIPGEELKGSIAAAELVAWYCGNPDVHPDTDQPAGDRLMAADIHELITSRPARRRGRRRKCRPRRGTDLDQVG